MLEDPLEMFALEGTFGGINRHSRLQSAVVDGGGM